VAGRFADGSVEDAEAGYGSRRAGRTTLPTVPPLRGSSDADPRTPTADTDARRAKASGLAELAAFMIELPTDV
jgi:hypothetical protein